MYPVFSWEFSVFWIWGVTMSDEYCRDMTWFFSKGYSLYSTSHCWLSWYFLKYSSAHASVSVKPPGHFIYKIYFWSKGFFMIPCWVSAADTTSADLEKVLPGLSVCLCSPLSFSFIPECRFEVVFMQIEQFSTSLLHYFVTYFLLFPTCLPDLVLASTSKYKW